MDSGNSAVRYAFGHAIKHIGSIINNLISKAADALSFRLFYFYFYFYCFFTQAGCPGVYAVIGN
jgi:hypothetical protein